MSSAADTLNVERSYLGVAEETPPPHSNRTIIGEKFGWNGVAWCAEFVSVCMAEAGVAFNGSASCSVLVARYQSGENGEWLGNPGTVGLRPGDNGFLGSRGQDHTFLVESVDGDVVHCIDGNWGDRVCRVSRPVGAIFGFGRPNYDGAAADELPPPSATAGRPILRHGSQGTPVGDEQRWLNAFAAAGLEVDDDFGDNTQAAVEAFQRSNGLTDDGIVGPDTYALQDRIVAWCAAQGAPPPPPDAPPFPGTIVLGSTGPAVIAFQSRLAARGWPVGRIDGIDGKTTTSILEQYQAEKGLTKDGIGGPETWVSLWTSPVT